MPQLWSANGETRFIPMLGAMCWGNNAEMISAKCLGIYFNRSGKNGYRLITAISYKFQLTWQDITYVCVLHQLACVLLETNPFPVNLHGHTLLKQHFDSELSVFSMFIYFSLWVHVHTCSMVYAERSEGSFLRVSSPCGFWGQTPSLQA